MEAAGKAQASNARVNLFGRPKDVLVAARSGADPAINSRLGLMVEQACRTSLERASAKAPTDR